MIEEFRKLKAGMQIFLIVFSVFSIYGLFDSENVKAQELSAEQKVCCEKTKTGDLCGYTDESNCDPSFRKAATACEQTSFCKLGCGYDSLEGECFKNTPKAKCELEGNCTWVEKPSCDIPQCNVGCCVLSNECSLTTQAACKRETSLLPFANMTFLEDVTTELECVNQCRSQERGACVSSDNTCVFTTREDCTSRIGENPSNEDDIFGTNNKNVGFHPNTLCSNDNLGTECARQQFTGCVPGKDEVYWFDSCGNAENIYDGDKRKSFNNGFVLDKKDSCVLKGADDASCGNCDFPTGTLCGNADKNKKPAFGEFSCRDLTCNDINVSKTPSVTGPKKLGEGWCVFDGAVGFGLDVVGSRHFRRICINGQELTEPCKDFREEICIQGVSGKPPLSLSESLGARGEYVEAACRGNRFDDCKDQTSQDGCEDIAFRDCSWIQAGIAGTCVPFVPPGLKFWPGESTASPEADAESTCSKGGATCNVKFVRGGLKSEWKCVENCYCLEDEWLTAQAVICKSLGDCGAWYNIEQKFTSGGFSEDAPGEAEFTSSNAIFNPEDDPKNPYKFSSLFKRLLLPVGVVGASGIYSWIQGGGFHGAGPIKGTLFSSLGGLKSGSGGMGKALSDTAAGTWGKHLTFEAGNTIPKGTIVDGKVLGIPNAVTPGSSVPTDLALNVKSLPNGQFEVVGEGVKSAGAGTGVQGAGFLGTTFQILNTVAWLYTIYTIVDYALSKEKEETYTVTCGAWVAPKGGDDCEKCGKDGKECSEYRCKSLGQLCELVNPGTENELCVNKHPNDVTSPIISADKHALKEQNYTIEEEVNKGFTIKNKIEPFTPVKLFISTNEPSQCKFGLNNSIKYEEMVHFFGDGLYLYNHTMQFSLPSELQEEQALKLTNGGRFSIFTRCQDATGNANNKDYYIRFEVSKGPDLTPPVIEVTSINNNAFAPSGIKESVFSAYVNEPSECKWSKQDKEFDLMENSFSCKSSGFDVSSIYYGLYECKTVLNGIEDNLDNDFFFRCKDQVGKKNRNVNSESFKFKLKGTIPLEITSIGPQGKVFDPNIELKVNTRGGALKGAARCGFSDKDVEVGKMIEFVNTNNTVHSQPFINITPGNYGFFVKCVDVAGNIANSSVVFDVERDIFGSKLSHVYTEGNVLHVEMDEETDCEYNSKGFFEFGTGTPMTGKMSKVHEATLDKSVYYLVCKDKFNNLFRARIFP